MKDGIATVSRGRLVAFRVIAIIGAVFLGGVTVAFLVLTFVDDEQEIHALHNVAGAAIYIPLFVVPLVAAVRDPLGSVAAFRIALAASVAVVVTGVIGGTIASALITFVVVLVLLWLHPARNEVLRLGALDVPLLAIVAVAAIPAVVYGLGEADLQANRPTSDPHAQFEHYAGMAAGAVGLILAGATAAFGGPGERLARWLVGLGGAALATSFLVYPDHVSAIDRGWAAAALVLSVLYLAAAEVDAGRAT
jgi:hypothetical protein